MGEVKKEKPKNKKRTRQRSQKEYRGEVARRHKRPSQKEKSRCQKRGVKSPTICKNRLHSVIYPSVIYLLLFTLCYLPSVIYIVCYL